VSVSFGCGAGEAVLEWCSCLRGGGWGLVKVEVTKDVAFPIASIGSNGSFLCSRRGGV